MSEQYADEDVVAAVAVLERLHKVAPCDHDELFKDFGIVCHVHAIRAVLDDLAERGRLLPPGGETREERQVLFGGVTNHRAVTSWPDGTQLVGPWVEVPAEPARFTGGKAPCELCGKPTTLRCGRCGRALCAPHAAWNTRTQTHPSLGVACPDLPGEGRDGAAG